MYLDVPFSFFPGLDFLEKEANRLQDRTIMADTPLAVHDG